MKAASISEIKKQLATADREELQELCLRLVRYRKENKELLTYLLFEAQDEQAYVREVRHEVDALFEDLPKGNVYFVKKGVRKILRYINKQIKYSGIADTELEVRIYFCEKMRATHINLQPGTVLFNMYNQQIKKIQSVWSKLPEDLQFDYARALKEITNERG